MTVRTERFTNDLLDGVTLHCAHWGAADAPLVVLLHGGGANHHWWDHLAPSLAKEHHVVGLDFRGHGDSDHPDEVEVGAFHRDLEAMLRHLGAADLALVGHSLGAHVALHHASTHDGVRALILIDPSRGAGRTERRRSRLALLARRSYASREEAIDRYRFVPPAPNAPEALRHWVASRSVEQDAAGRWRFKFDPRWFGLPASEPPDLSRIGAPCLIVRGRDSTLLTSDGAAELARELPDARVVEIEGGGHNIHLERPEAVLSALAAPLRAFSRATWNQL